MSQENVEIVRGVFEAWNARDMDAVRESYDPDVMIVRGPEGWPELAPVVGLEAVIGYFEQLRETWDFRHSGATSDLIDVGARVVVRPRVRFPGRSEAVTLVSVKPGPFYDFVFTGADGPDS